MVAESAFSRMLSLFARLQSQTMPVLALHWPRFPELGKVVPPSAPHPRKGLSKLDQSNVDGDSGYVTVAPLLSFPLAVSSVGSLATNDVLGVMLLVTTLSEPVFVSAAQVTEIKPLLVPSTLQ